MKASRQPVQFGNMQLKYCERCGNIWVRRSGSTQPLCASCKQAEASLAGGPISFLSFWNRLRAEAQA
jgi:hypothetical protein